MDHGISVPTSSTILKLKRLRPTWGQFTNEKLTKLRRDLQQEAEQGLGKPILKDIRWLLLKKTGQNFGPKGIGRAGKKAAASDINTLKQFSRTIVRTVQASWPTSIAMVY